MISGGAIKTHLFLNAREIQKYFWKVVKSESNMESFLQTCVAAVSDLNTITKLKPLKMSTKLSYLSEPPSGI